MRDRRGTRRLLPDFAALEERALLTTLIAIVDSGIDLNDASVVPYLDLTKGYDAYNKQAYSEVGPRAILDTSLAHGHGSVVAEMTVQGIQDAAKAAGDRPLDVKIMPIRDTSSGLNIDANALIRGVYWAADHGASVINLSVNIYYNPTLHDPAHPHHGASLVQAIQYAESKGAIVVTGPGNNGRSIDTIAVFPAYADDAMYSIHRPTPNNVLVAAATDAEGNLTPVSNYGPIHVDLGAYAGPEGYTSYSSAYAAGVAGVVAELAPDGTTPRQLLDILEETVTQRDQRIHAWSKTDGVLNPAAAVERALAAHSPTPPPTTVHPKPSPTTGLVAINAGGREAGVFASDRRFSGGLLYSTNATIDTSAVAFPAPQAVYQTERYGNFTYTVDQLAPDASYKVRLDFTEIFHDGPNRRLFDVAINGVPVLDDFDLFAAAGGKNKAIAREFQVRADASGTIQIAFQSVRDNAKVDAITVSPATDLAQGKPAFSSSVESAHYAPGRAVDGDTATRWSSGQWMQSTQTGWFAVDLQNLYQITDVSLYWEKAHAVDYQIQVSADAASWTTIQTVTGNHASGPVDFTGLSGVGRYVRVLATKTSAGANNYSLYDLQVRGLPATDLAAGKPATASGSAGAANAPAAAVDQNPSTFWSSGPLPANLPTAWIRVDLGGLHRIDGVRLNWGNAPAASYEIQTSLDGAKWTTLRTAGGEGGVAQFTGLDGVGRYVRIQCVKLAPGASGYSLRDLNVHGSPLEDLAVGRPAFASSVEGIGFDPSRALDHDLGTRWSSGQWKLNTQTAWFAVDLGARFDLHEVQLNWETAFAVDFQIQVSDDGQDWTTVRSVVGNNAKGPQTLSGLAGSGRYVRILCTKTSAGSNNYSLFDVKVFGSPTASTTLIAIAPPPSETAFDPTNLPRRSPSPTFPFRLG